MITFDMWGYAVATAVVAKSAELSLTQFSEFSENMASKRSLLKLVLLPIMALLVMLVMLRLGVWQLERAAFKQDIVDRRVQQSELPAIDLDKLMLPTEYDEYRFRAVSMSPLEWSGEVILHDNEVLNKRVGYDVYTIAKSGAGTSILVKLGWQGKPMDLVQVEQIVAQFDRATVVGRLNLLPSPPPLWSQNDAAVSGRIWQFLPLQQLQEQYDSTVFPLVLELRPGSDSPLKLVWRQIETADADVHRAYALQWFAMAAALLIFCLIGTVRRLRASRSKS